MTPHKRVWQRRILGKMEYKRDFEELKPYYEAFWNCGVLDRVAVSVYAPKSGDRSRWTDWSKPSFVAGEPPEKILDFFEKDIGCGYCGGLAVPYFWPNFGPDVFSAFLGVGMNYSSDSDSTSWADWSEPFLKDYSCLNGLHISDENPLYRKNMELLRLAAERGKNRYLVGVTDLHAGFDSLAVLRGGPDRAVLDLVDNPDGVRDAMRVLFNAWRKVYSDYYSVVRDIQPGTNTWISIFAPGKMYPVQNDFSCLVSPGMYRGFFLEELLAEIEYLDYSIYHLDGVEALQHLDILLEIPRLNAIQWVSGARFGESGIARWFSLYKKIQEKKKAIIVYARIEEIDLVLENLRPEGLLISTSADSVEEADAVLKKLGWKR